MTAAYVANGTRLADSLAAGQLTGGPILLVRNDTKIPEFTSNVATHLLCWNGKAIKVSAIGGEGVVSDDVLSTMVNLIGTKSVCKVKDTTPAAPATASAKPTLGAVTGSPITTATGSASVSVTSPLGAPAVYTCAIDKESIDAATSGKVNFAVAWDATAKACKVTASDDSHVGAVSGTIKVTVKVDEDGAGTAKTVSPGADENVSVNIS